MSNSIDFGSPNIEDAELRSALISAFGSDALDWLDDDQEDLSNEMNSSSTFDETTVKSAAEVKLDNAFERISNSIQDHSAEQLSLVRFEKRSRTRTENAIRYIAFEVGEQRFGIPLKSVQEIDRCGKITVLPRTPDWLRGITNLRGKIFSVTDFRKLLNLNDERPATGEKIIVVKSNRWETRTAILVDRVLGIRSLGSAVDSSALTGPLATIAIGVATIKDDSIVLIQPDLLLGCSDLRIFSNS